jgi:YfiH family protein
VPFYQAGDIKYFRFPSLENLEIYHAIYTRQGGFSPSPWSSLNFGASVGDEIDRVKQNRWKALSALDINPLNVYDVYQVHGDQVVITDRPLEMNETHIKADAIITNQRKVTLLMRFADCVPILMFDPIAHVIGIAHAGWAGTVNKIAAKVVAKMRQNFGSKSGDIMTAIGPSIGPEHYPVGEDVIAHVRRHFGDQIERLIRCKNGKSYLDLWKANQLVLNEAGVNQVEIAGICTQCNVADWYSHRAEHGKTGRFGAVLGLI